MPFKRVTDSPNARREARRPQGRCEGSPRSGPHGLPEERWDLGGFGYDSATQRSARPPSSGLGAGAADRGPCRYWTDAQQGGRAWGHCTTQGRSQLGLPDGQLMRTAVSRGCFLRKHDLKGWFFYMGLPPISMQRDVHQHGSPAGARGPPGALWALSSQPGPLPSGRDTVVADPHGGEDSRDGAGGCGAGPAVSPGPGSISGHPWQWAAWPPRPSSALPGQCSLHAPGTACGLGHPAQVPGGEMALQMLSGASSWRRKKWSLVHSDPEPVNLPRLCPGTATMGPDERRTRDLVPVPKAMRTASPGWAARPPWQPSLHPPRPPPPLSHLLWLQGPPHGLGLPSVVQAPWSPTDRGVMSPHREPASLQVPQSHTPVSVTPTSTSWEAWRAAFSFRRCATFHPCFWVTLRFRNNVFL